MSYDYARGAEESCLGLAVWFLPVAYFSLFCFTVSQGARKQAQAHLRVARKQVPLAPEGDPHRSRPRQER